MKSSETDGKTNTTIVRDLTTKEIEHLETSRAEIVNAENLRNEIEDHKQSAKQKLLNLGLTDEEIVALVG